ncbi:MAG: protein TolR [Holophagales bacterium]|nr:protein TolR [Holophagales bacterium]
MALRVGSHGEDEDILSEINITPLVDVMLVLLIIFMITAPMLHQGIEVALPKSEAQTLPTRAQDPLILSINRDGLVYVRDQPVHPTKLVEVLTPMLRARQNEMIFLKGDRDVAYGRVIEVLDTLRRGGIVQVGMVTDRDETSSRRR